METVPVSPVESQMLTVVLGGQACQVGLYQKSTGCFLDLYLNDKLIVGGAACLSGVPIVRQAYSDFIGDLAFVDTEGSDDPDYTGLGSRWALLYFPS